MSDEPTQPAAPDPDRRFLDITAGPIVPDPTARLLSADFDLAKLLGPDPLKPMLPKGIEIKDILGKDVGLTFDKLGEVERILGKDATIGKIELPDIGYGELTAPIFTGPSQEVLQVQATREVREEISGLATIAKAQLEGLAVVKKAITDLGAIVDNGQRQMVWPTRLTIGLAAVLVVQTFALIFLGWALVVRTP